MWTDELQMHVQHGLKVVMSKAMWPCNAVSINGCHRGVLIVQVALLCSAQCHCAGAVCGVPMPRLICVASSSIIPFQEFGDGAAPSQFIRSE
jgi:hypothetical protein